MTRRIMIEVLCWAAFGIVLAFGYAHYRADPRSTINGAAALHKWERK